MDFEQAKAYLQKDAGGVNIYDHLSTVLLRLLIEKPKNSVEMLEHISHMVKKGHYTPTGANATERTLDIEKIIAFAAANAAFYAVEEDGLGEGAPVQDLMADVDSLEWAGVSLGREETFRIYNNLKKLSSTSGATDLRFWGKIQGREGDYYIAEGAVDVDTDEESSAEAGGPNKFTYWVASTSCGAWSQLPQVTPEQINAARDIKQYFTGNLDATVKGHPPFPGKEREYLRSQIARISSSTMVSPNGVYALTEVGDEIVLNEEEGSVDVKSVAELNDISNWVHIGPEINVRGRYKVDEAVDEEGNPIEDPTSPEVVPLLKPLSEDKSQSWATREVGGGGSHSMAVLKSLNWPGAVTVGFSMKYTSVYVGFGQKFSETTYTPSSPVEIMGEYKEGDLKEQDDLLQDPTPPEEEEEAEEEEE